MSAATDYSENALVEKPAIAPFGDLGWDTANCFYEQFGPGGTLGRETEADVVLTARLRPALTKLNPTLDAEAIGLAIEELTRDRSAMSPARANREVYQLLKEGVKVTVKSGDDGDDTAETVRVIDWNEPSNNDYFLASQFWVVGDMYTRRCDWKRINSEGEQGIVSLETMIRGTCEPGRLTGDRRARDPGRPRVSTGQAAGRCGRSAYRQR